MNWLLELSLFVTSAVLGGELCKKIKVSPLIGEILAGIAFSAAYHFLHFPKDVFILTIFSELGVLFILFLIGTETDLNLLRKVTAPAFSVAFAGVAVPFVCGLGLGWYYGWTQPVTLFAAATLVATSIAISAKAFMELDFVKQRSSQVVLGAAVIDDVLGLLVLTFVMATVGGEGGNSLWEQLGKVAFFLFFILPAVWFLLPKAMTPIEKFFGSDARGILYLAFLFFLCFLSYWYGLAPILGAFFLGVLVSVRHDPHLVRIVHPFFLVLGPLFFFGIGFHVDINALFTGIGLSLVFTGVAIVSKWVGGFLGAAALRIPFRESVLIGVAMIPRGEVGLIIAGIGHTMKIVDDQIFAAAAFMCLATTLLPPFFLPALIRWVQQDKKHS